MYDNVSGTHRDSGTGSDRYEAARKKKNKN